MQVGAGAITELGKIMNNMGYNNPLIITDSMMVELGYISKIEENLNNNDITADIFKDTIPEPTVKSIQAGVNKVKEGNYDSQYLLGLCYLKGDGVEKDVKKVRKILRIKYTMIKTIFRIALLFSLFIVSFEVNSQKTFIHTDPYRSYKVAQELFDKGKIF